MGAINELDTKLHNLIQWLEDWAEWQQGYRMRLSYPSHSAGFHSGGYNSSKTFDDMADESDTEICRLVDYAIDDLTPVQSAAIYRRYLSAVFRFERVSYVEALAEAHARLLESLPKKGVVL